jgi:polycomb protein EED
MTGGHDHRICVWTLPDLANESSFWQDIAPENRKRSSHEVKVIHFPHFITSAVHGDFVDCVRFFGDLVISKACIEGKIVLWKITGFDTRKPPPASTTAPKTEGYLDTRNGFMRTTTRNKNGVETVEVAPEYHGQPPYERLLELDSPNSNTFYLRFALLLPSPSHPELHPALAFGSEATQLRFWDLERLSLGHSGGLDKIKPRAAKSKKEAALRANRIHITPQLLADEQASPSLVRESTVSSTSNISSGPWPHRQSSTEATSEISEDPTANSANPPFPVPDRKRHPLHNPHQPIKSHETVTLTSLQYKNRSSFVTRTSDWSPCGRWCIAVGESTLHGEGWGGFAVLYR